MSDLDLVCELKHPSGVSNSCNGLLLCVANRWCFWRGGPRLAIENCAVWGLKAKPGKAGWDGSGLFAREPRRTKEKLSRTRKQDTIWFRSLFPLSTCDPSTHARGFGTAHWNPSRETDRPWIIVSSPETKTAIKMFNKARILEITRFRDTVIKKLDDMEPYYFPPINLILETLQFTTKTSFLCTHQSYFVQRIVGETVRAKDDSFLKLHYNAIDTLLKLWDHLFLDVSVTHESFEIFLWHEWWNWEYLSSACLAISKCEWNEKHRSPLPS